MCLSTALVSAMVVLMTLISTSYDDINFCSAGECRLKHSKHVKTYALLASLSLFITNEHVYIIDYTDSTNVNILYD